MFCPTCGSEERQLSQYCRACGTDLRVVRQGLERPDSVTASAITARDHISQAIADKIRDTQSASELQKVVAEVLPRIEEFIQSPEEKRLRRIRAGMVTAAIGLGAALLVFWIGLFESDMLPFTGVGLAAFLIGLGILINGLVFTVPRKKLPSANEIDQDSFEPSLRTLAALPKALVAEVSTNELRPSVTEHTTHHLQR